MDGIIRHLKIQELTVRLFRYELENRSTRRELVSASNSNARQGEFFVRQALMRTKRAALGNDLK